MTDYITRGQAIEAVTHARYDREEQRKALKGIPSADVEPVVKGKWVENKYGWTCTNCHQVIDEDQFVKDSFPPFCPCCGAKMEAPVK